MQRLPCNMSKAGVSRIMFFVFLVFSCLPKKGGCADLVLIRHGEAMNNVYKFFSTNQNNPGYRVSNLTALGQAQVKIMARRLRAMGYNQQSIDRIVYSPLPRTRQTAEILAAELGIPASRLTSDHRIQDVDVGHFEGKTTENLPKNDLKLLFRKIVPMGGEKPEDIVRRVVSAHRDALEPRHKNHHVIMITHKLPASLFLEKIHREKTILATGGYDVLNQDRLMNALSSLAQ